MISVKSERDVAISSNDHLHPWGAAHDNSRNHKFNEILYSLFPHESLAILDLGCAGGGFVKDCLDDGHFAVGLEGSDYPKLNHKGEWDKIPNNLFTCDVTGNFQVLVNGLPFQFDVITSWEFLEHIEEKDLPMVFSNIAQHMHPGSLWIVSVSTWGDVVDGIPMHRTIKPREWWMQTFKNHGFVWRNDLEPRFHGEFIRGPCSGEYHSFNMILGYGGEIQ